MIQPNTPQAVNFLKGWQPKGPWNLTAIHPTSMDIENRTFMPDTVGEAVAWIDKWQNKRNIYFTTNGVKPGLSKKPKKTDITWNLGAFVDIDPMDGEAPADAKERITQMLDEFPIKPTVTLFSGGGCQAFWKLRKPAHVNGNIEELEEVNVKLERLLGGDNCHNIDRIMRVPGTVNLPNAKKKKKGRKPIRASIIERAWDRLYDMKDFEVLPMLPAKAAKWLGPCLVTGQRPDLEEKYPSRSEACMAIIGEMKRCRMDRDEVYELMLSETFEVTGHVSEDKDPERNFDRKWDTVKGGDEDITKGNDEALEVVEELNEFYAQIIEEGKHRILYEGPSPNEDEKIVFYDVAAFKAYYAGRSVILWPGSKHPKAVPITDVWLQSSLRRKVRGLIFQPNGDYPEYYNLWKGWPLEPKPGDWSLFRDHLYFNVSGGDPELFQYFMSWWAHKLQFPEKKIGTSLVLKGGEGMGKTTVAVFFHKLIGQYFKTVSSPHLVTGHFNAHLANALILHSEEAFWAGDKSGQSKINDIITGHTHQIEFKGRDARQMPSFMDMLIMGNPDWLVPAGPEARRFAVYTMTKSMSPQQFQEMRRQMENGGYEGMMHDLVGWDVTSKKAINLQTVPKTEGLLLQKEMSLEPHMKMLLEIAHDGVIPGTFAEKKDTGDEVADVAMRDVARSVHTGIFYKAYVERVRATGLRAVDMIALGRHLKKFGVEKVRVMHEGLRANFYIFPTLPWFRAAFAEYMRQPIQWDNKALDWMPELESK
jgi:hypothetical protein